LENPSKEERSSYFTVIAITLKLVSPSNIAAEIETSPSFKVIEEPVESPSSLFKYSHLASRPNELSILFSG
jgi:hypothetical protein